MLTKNVTLEYSSDSENVEVQVTRCQVFVTEKNINQTTELSDLAEVRTQE
jgi:hypothetical protein